MTAAAATRLGLARGLVVLVVALAAQAWVLPLWFQFDDFHLLSRPGSLFRAMAAREGAPVETYMMRFPVWAAWTLAWELSPRPLSPALFHGIGWVLHGLAAWLLAAGVTRFLPVPRARTAGLIAGIGFGVSIGGAQALSWISGHPDVFVVTFGLAALYAFLAAREGPGVWRVAAVIALLVALFSKGSALVLVPVLTLVLLAPAPAAARPRRLLELGALGVCVALTLGARWLYLGHALPTYPGDSGFEPRWISGAVLQLGQALVPLNRDPLVADTLPALVAERILGPWRPFLAQELALVFTLPALLGLCSRGSRGVAALVGLGAVVLFVALPSGAIAPGPHAPGTPATNAIGRTLYTALCVVWIGIAAGGALLVERHRLGWAALALAFVPTVVLRGHVIETERIADAARRGERDAVLAAAADLRERFGRSAGEEFGLVAVLAPRSGFAGIAMHGVILPAGTRPPFTAFTGVLVETPDTEAELAGIVGDPRLLPLDVAVLSERGGADTTPAGRRSAREWVPRAPAVRGAPEREVWATELIADGPGRFVLAAPLPARAVAGLALDAPAGEAAVSVVWEDAGGGRRALECAATIGADERWFVPTPRGLDALLGPPLVAVEVRRDASSTWTPAEASLRPELPAFALRPVGATSAGAAISLEPMRAPRVVVARPHGWPRPQWLRFTLELERFEHHVTGICDVPWPADEGSPVELELSAWHTQTELHPSEAQAHGVPWELFAPGFLVGDGLRVDRIRLSAAGHGSRGPATARSLPLGVRLAEGGSP